MRELSGVFPAVVIDNVDSENLGRVKVRLPQFDAAGCVWARLATLMAGTDRGTWFVPDVNDEVLVAFEAGDLRRPYVIGSMWNGTNSPPTKMDADNNIKLLRSRNGVTISLDDEKGQESLILETPGGQKVTLKDGPASVEIVDSNGNSVVLGTAGVTVIAAAKVTINAATVEINSGMVTVNTGMSKFSGVVQCDTLISNAVVSASYTPGAGNVA